MSEVPSFNKKMSIFALLLASTCINLAFGILLPFLPFYVKDIAKELNFLGIALDIGFQVGILTSAFMISRCILAPTYGKLSDTKGRKPIILIGMAMYGFLCLGFAFATDVLTLFIVRLGQGVASAAVWPVAESLIADLSDEKDFGKHMGWYMLSMQLGFALGPFIGAAANLFFLGTGIAVTEIISFRLIFFSVASLSFLSVPFILYYVIDPKIAGRIALKDVKETIVVMLRASIHAPMIFVQTIGKAFSTSSDPDEAVPRGIFGMALANGFGFALIWPIMTLFYIDYYISDTNLILMLIGIVSIAALMFNPIGGYLSDRIGRKVIVVGTGFLGVIATVILGVQVTLFMLFGLLLIRQAISAINMPAFRALQAEIVPEKVRGEIFGVVQALFNVGGVFGPIVGGLLYDAFPGYFTVNILGLNITFFGTIVLFSITAALSLFATCLILFFVHPKKKEASIEEDFVSFESTASVKQDTLQPKEAGNLMD
ncbi:MAG: MFS transporter [Promethearchaeota archaeon]